MLSFSGRRMLVGLAVVVSLTSCQSRPPLTDSRRVERSEDVANVFVSAYPAVAWSAVADKLEPKNNLSTTDARAMAAIATQSQISQFLSTFAAGLGIGLPSSTSSSTTTLAADGTSTTTGTRKRDSGAVPSSSGASAVGITDANLVPDLTKGPFAYGVDASTQLTVGSSVYQLAQILDNQISKSIAPKGYQAHLLTFQVNLQPKGRNLPYDAYINLTLLPASWQTAVAGSESMARDSAALSPVIVYPLVISDSMESSYVGRSLETIRQAAFALSGVVGGVGVNGSVAGGSDNLQALLGSDRNSLLTVGRLSDHTLRIRLGAQQQGSRQLALVPRTHNISIVVFTKVDDENAKLDIGRLAVITQVTFLDVDTGMEVPSFRNTDDGRKNLASRVATVISNYGYSFSAACASDIHKPVDMLRSLDRGDYSTVKDCIVIPGVTSERKETDDEASRRVAADELRLKRVIAELMTIQTDSRFSKLVVQLTDRSSRLFKSPYLNQLVLLNDDKSSSKAVLRSGANLDSKALDARLRLTSNDEKFELVATSIETDAAGKALTVVFPSLSASKLMTTKPNPERGKPDIEADPTDMSILVLRTDRSDVLEGLPAKGYPVKLLKPKQEGPSNPVSASTSVLVSDASGSARVTLVVGEWDAKKSGDLAIRVLGADVRSTVPAVAIDAKRRAVPIAGASAITLTLENLTSAQAVQITTLANKEPVGPPLVFSVESRKGSDK